MKRFALIFTVLAFALEFLVLPEIHLARGCHGGLQHDDDCPVCHLAHHVPLEPAPIEIAPVIFETTPFLRPLLPSKTERLSPLYSVDQPRAPPSF